MEENLRLGLAARRARAERRRARARVRALPGSARVPLAPGRRAVGRAAAAAGDRARARRRSRACSCSTSRRSDSRRRSSTSSSRRYADQGRRPRDPARRAARAADGRARRPTPTCSRTASFASRSARRTRATPTGSSPPISHDSRVPQPLVAGVRRRSRARRHLRADGRRDRSRLRRAAARQLRLRPADHGRRVRACLRRAVGPAELALDPLLLRRRARALGADGPARLPARCGRTRRR